MAIYWLSFADGRKPRGSQWLGGCMVEAPSFMTAVDKAHRLKINPGGEVKGSELQDNEKTRALLAAHGNKLFTTKAEMASVFGGSERF